MKKFFKQQGAFDALKVGQCVFQNQTGGTRYYVACTNEEYWKKYLEKGDRFGYELIMKGTPCHLYVDLDINREKYNIHVTDVWSIIEKWIDVTLQFQFNIPEDHITKHLLFSSNEKKGSMHVVYNIKDRIFQTNAHVGAFMRCVKEVIKIQSPESMSIFTNGFVDMAIYTPNRLFRMLGCAKWGTARYLSNNDTFTYENWVKTKVQPIESQGKFIEVTEYDGSEPKYNMVNCTVDINDNYMKEAIDYISETHSKVIRKKRYLERESRFLNETEYSRKKRLKSASAGGRRRKDGCSCDSCDSILLWFSMVGNTLFCADMCTECCNACNAL